MPLQTHILKAQELFVLVWLGFIWLGFLGGREGVRRLRFGFFITCSFKAAKLKINNYSIWQEIKRKKGKWNLINYSVQTLAETPTMKTLSLLLRQELTSLCVVPSSSSNKLHLSSATRNLSLTWKGNFELFEIIQNRKKSTSLAAMPLQIINDTVSITLRNLLNLESVLITTHVTKK